MADRPSRKLAVILHADVVSSTALVQRNESLAHERIQDSFRRFSETITAYGGTTQEIRGDALVAEFARASDAVIAGIAFQIENTDSKAQLEDGIRPQLRIGISLGEVIIADNTITGAGVVLAQRLEQIAEPGGVVVQGSVSETVPTRLPLEFESLGEKTLKGFDHPVRAFVVNLKSGEPVPDPESNAVTPEVGTDIDRQRAPLELPDKPSIAVMPFTNMSDDSDQEYFSDGITEDIITELSRFREIFVIARNSSFTFKNQVIDVSEVAAKLGVQYVVEGSVRKAADRVRITVQLIDGLTANHIWADRYDRVLEDIFTVQDEVVAAIVSALPNQILQIEMSRPKLGPSKVRAYDLVLQASPSSFGNLDDTRKAITLLQQALDIEPDYAAAHSWLAAAYTIESDYQFEIRTDAIATKIMKHARHAVELDQMDDRAYTILSDVCLFVIKDLVEARIHAQRAVDLNPNATHTVAWMAYIHNCCGESERALEMCARAIRLDPLANGFVKFLQGVAYFDAGHLDLAIGAFLASDWGEKWPHLAAAYALSGKTSRASEVATRIRQEWGNTLQEGLDERMREIFKEGYWYSHGNHDGSFIRGLQLAGFAV